MPPNSNNSKTGSRQAITIFTVIACIYLILLNSFGFLATHYGITAEFGLAAREIGFTIINGSFSFISIVAIAYFFLKKSIFESNLKWLVFTIGITAICSPTTALLLAIALVLYSRQLATA